MATAMFTPTEGGVDGSEASTIEHLPPVDLPPGDLARRLVAERAECVRRAGVPVGEAFELSLAWETLADLVDGQPRPDWRRRAERRLHDLHVGVVPGRDTDPSGMT